MKKTALALVLGLACSLPALAINKCTLSNGKVAYQDAPCEPGIGKAEMVRHLEVNTLGSGSNGSVNQSDAPDGQLSSVKGSLESLESLGSDCVIGLKVYGMKGEGVERCSRFQRAIGKFTPLVKDAKRLFADPDLKGRREFADINGFISRINSHAAFVGSYAEAVR